LARNQNEKKLKTKYRYKEIKIFYILFQQYFKAILHSGVI